MLNKCILLTYQFPYLAGEPFLENEIFLLSEKFEKVYIFSIDICGNETQTRALPKNVISLKPSIPRKNNIFYIKKSFSGVGKHYKKNNINPLKTIANLYFCGRINVIFDELKKALQPFESKLNNTLVYSYWNTYLSLVGIEYSKYLKSLGKQVKIVSRCHGYDCYSYTNKLNYNPFYEKSLNELEYLFPCSQNGVDYLNKRYGYHENIILQRLATTDFSYKNNFHFDNAITFVTCARFIKIKRHDLFLKAFALAYEKNKNIKWIAIGDGKEFENIKKLIKRYGLQDCVKLLGRIPNSDVIKFYKNEDISYFVNVSSTEGAPVSVMEAQSFGIPCIVTDVGGSSELVNNENGFVIDKNISVKELTIIILKAASLTKNDFILKAERTRNDWKKMSSPKNYENFINFILKD